MIHQIKKRVQKHTISFSNAVNGIRWAFESQPNYQIHFVLSILAIVFGNFFEISKLEWIVIIILITLGICIETINSSLEQALDCVSLTKRDDIRIAKDASAGAMLIFSFGAVIVAVIIFYPYFSALYL
jgi:undecaprenol kinase